MNAVSTRKFINSLTHVCGQMLIKNFGRIQVCERKTGRDIVTDIDRKVENKIIQSIRKNYPDHSIYSEETDKIIGRSEYLWIIDPLDGTVNYTSGIPLFCVSIGLVHRDQCLYGAVYAPYLREFFYAEKNRGAYFNHRKIFVSKTKKLEDSIIHVGLSPHYSPALIRKNWQIIQPLSHKVRGLRMFESGPLTSCYVACGRIDGKISIKTDAFGNAASSLIVEEAGGMVTDFQGQPWRAEMKDMICSNKFIYHRIKKLVQSY